MAQRLPKNRDLWWARLVNGYSQEELAREVRTSRQTISALEHAKRLPSVSLALALARRLNRSVEELFGSQDLR
jgi:putative transcriptional regulator